MKNKQLSNGKLARAGLSVGALALLGAFATHRFLQAEGGGAARGAPSHAASAAGPQPAAERDLDAARSSNERAARDAQAAAESRARVRETATAWFDQALEYFQQDRATVLEATLAKLVATGPAGVFELERQLSETTIYEQERRAATFHALGRIGKELKSSQDPSAKQALTAIVNAAQSELELPALVEPNPELDLALLPENERHELLHQGILVEADGELLQPTTLNKLPVIRMLRGMGGDASRELLKRLDAEPDNAPGLKLAIEQAIQNLG